MYWLKCKTLHSFSLCLITCSKGCKNTKKYCQLICWLFVGLINRCQKVLNRRFIYFYVFTEFEPAKLSLSLKDCFVEQIYRQSRFFIVTAKMNIFFTQIRLNCFTDCFFFSTKVNHYSTTKLVDVNFSNRFIMINLITLSVHYSLS